MIVASNKIETWLVTTPQELRELADQMEKQVKAAKLGDSCTVKTVETERIILHISWDQDKTI